MGSSVEDIVAKMRRAPANVRYSELFKVCESYFGAARQTRGSHAIFKTPWQGDPRVNIQDYKGQAKRFQVLQVLEAIDKMETLKEG